MLRKHLVRVSNIVAEGRQKWLHTSEALVLASELDFFGGPADRRAWRVQ